MFKVKRLPLLKRFLFKGGFSFLITNASFILASWSDMDFFYNLKIIQITLFTKITLF